MPSEKTGPPRRNKAKISDRPACQGDPQLQSHSQDSQVPNGPAIAQYRQHVCVGVGVGVRVGVRVRVGDKVQVGVGVPPRIKYT